MSPSYGWDSAVPRLKCHYEETVYFLLLSYQEVLVLIWLTSKGWKAESTFGPPSEFKLETSRLEIQCPMHWAIGPWKPVRWEPISRYQRKIILHTVSIIHYSIGLSNTREEHFPVITLDLLKDFDRVVWNLIFCGISFSFVNLVTRTNSFTWLKLLPPIPSLKLK